MIAIDRASTSVQTIVHPKANNHCETVSNQQANHLLGLGSVWVYHCKHENGDSSQCRLGYNSGSTMQSLSRWFWIMRDAAASLANHICCGGRLCYHCANVLLAPTWLFFPDNMKLGQCSVKRCVSSQPGWPPNSLLLFEIGMRHCLNMDENGIICKSLSTTRLSEHCRGAKEMEQRHCSKLLMAYGVVASSYQYKQKTHQPANPPTNPPIGNASHVQHSLASSFRCQKKLYASAQQTGDLATVVTYKRWTRITRSSIVTGQLCGGQKSMTKCKCTQDRAIGVPK